MQRQGLGQLENPMTSSGVETREFPAFSIAPYPTKLPIAPTKIEYAISFLNRVISSVQSGIPFLTYFRKWVLRDLYVSPYVIRIKNHRIRK
jgi:hypothetical protein